ncbi:hypothetical protein B0J11DRAFT_605192 [Dendryphion nanum]|uniref:NACHT domain-containing protein n=1 Tax=Dendryphion nanum TaxID=256645 RepID=A0A9P9DXT0_9PLEO|nr:hypothetical protein B0J11DRAFT_605192 [Dendryphion nanum]
MEALVAVGLAGNVVQFIQFAGKLISEVKSIRETGSPSSFPRLKEVVENLVKQAEIIHQCLTAKANTTQLTQEDQHLVDIAANCQKTGAEFLEYLDKFIPSAPVGIFKGAVRTIRIQFARHKIEEFVIIIDRLQSALTLATTMALRSNGSLDHHEIISRLQELREREDDHDNTLNHITGLLKTIVEPRNSLTLPALNNQIGQCMSAVEEIRKQLLGTREHRVLMRLSFRQIQWRFEEITAAHQETFAWIFQKPTTEHAWDDFTQHLVNNVSRPYFIEGKAGSGKSTLMKYITKHHDLKKLLLRWASTDNKELIIIKFFFWNLGTPLQKSTTGFLRSSMWTVLRQYPELIPVVFPDIYHSLDTDTEDLTYVELRRAWASLLEKSQQFLKIAFLIDGLDEFEGNHTDLADFLTKACSPNVKVVASSRPINAALHAFRDCPSLRLQELTKQDMKNFIHSELVCHELMFPLARCYPEISSKIIREIEEKAQGVFLWVRLVIELLISSLKAGDSIEELQVQLHSLPNDLRDLYRRMMSQIPLEYQLQAMEIFQILEQWLSFSKEVLPAMLLHYALRPCQESMDQEIGLLASETLAWHFGQICARIQSRCCGLLEIRARTCAANHCDLAIRTEVGVEYLHRTVAEFLRTADVKLEILETMGSEFDPEIRIAAGCLSMIKIASSKNTESIRMDYAVFLLELYKSATSTVRQQLEPYITAMDKTITQGNQNVRLQSSGIDSTNRWHWSWLQPAVSKVFGSNGTSQRNDLINHDAIDRDSNVFMMAAVLGFSQYLVASSSDSNFHSMKLLYPALSSWRYYVERESSLNDLRDTLIFLLHDIYNSDNVQIPEWIYELATEYSGYSERTFNVFLACWVVATPPSFNSWTSMYSNIQLRSISQSLESDEDPENKRLGLRMLQSMNDRLLAKEACVLCRLPGHTRETCRRITRK